MSATSLPKLGVLVSGRGSNLAALIAAIERGELLARIALVISSKPGVRALEIAEEADIATQVIAPKQYASRAEEGRAIVAALQAAGVDLVITAGYARIFDPCVVEAYPLRIVNIHPALLPAFPGMAPGPQAEALAYGVKIAGCTTHFITEDTDAGPIIDQATVPVLDGDTVETLSARILEQEHRLLPGSVAAVLASEIRVMGRRTMRVAPATPQGDATDARD
jgi:phosphoribosylglycinamide formyltransferase 1